MVLQLEVKNVKIEYGYEVEECVFYAPLLLKEMLDRAHQL